MRRVGAKTRAVTPTDAAGRSPDLARAAAKIDRWHNRIVAADDPHSRGAATDCLFLDVRRDVRAWIEARRRDFAAIEAALDDPFAPGAALVLERANRPWASTWCNENACARPGDGDDGESAFAALACIGEAIRRRGRPLPVWREDAQAAKVRT